MGGRGREQPRLTGRRENGVVTVSAGTGRPHRPDESMSLLTDIAQQALDPAYADAAARRAAVPGVNLLRRPARRSLVLLGVLAATLVLVLAAEQTQRRAPSAARSRDTLLKEVRGETADIAALQRRLDLLRGRIQRLRNSELRSTGVGAALAARLDTADLVAGTMAATGPGLRVVADDASSGGGSTNQVLDRDLQSLVNALWAAGAEAIAIDDQRVTAQTAIRQAGSSILVNFQPVARPYVITAIGDPVAMATSFGSSAAVARMRTYTQVYGLHFSFARADRLTVPSAPGLPLRFAKPVIGRRTGEARQ
jgi:uncharacterized protein YlxW (UPF0749 family)